MHNARSRRRFNSFARVPNASQNSNNTSRLIRRRRFSMIEHALTKLRYRVPSHSHQTRILRHKSHMISNDIEDPPKLMRCLSMSLYSAPKAGVPYDRHLIMVPAIALTSLTCIEVMRCRFPFQPGVTGR